MQKTSNYNLNQWDCSVKKMCRWHDSIQKCAQRNNKRLNRVSVSRTAMPGGTH